MNVGVAAFIAIYYIVIKWGFIPIKLWNVGVYRVSACAIPVLSKTLCACAGLVCLYWAVGVFVPLCRAVSVHSSGRVGLLVGGRCVLRSVLSEHERCLRKEERT